MGDGGQTEDGLNFSTGLSRTRWPEGETVLAALLSVWTVIDLLIVY